MTTVNVLLFGPQALMAGKRLVRVTIDAAAPTCSDVRDALRRCCPALGGSLGVSRIAINQRMARWDQTISAGDEIALIGLVGGG